MVKEGERTRTVLRLGVFSTSNFTKFVSQEGISSQGFAKKTMLGRLLPSRQEQVTEEGLKIVEIRGELPVYFETLISRKPALYDPEQRFGNIWTTASKDEFRVAFRVYRNFPKDGSRGEGRTEWFLHYPIILTKDGKPDAQTQHLIENDPQFRKDLSEKIKFACRNTEADWKAKGKPGPGWI